MDFLDELGNFKQKKFYTSKCNFFTFYNNEPINFFFNGSKGWIMCNVSQLKTRSLLIGCCATRCHPIRYFNSYYTFYLKCEQTL